MFRRTQAPTGVNITNDDTALIVTVLDQTLDAVDENYITMDAEPYIRTTNLRNRLATAVGISPR